MIGASIAYFLAARGVKATVIERDGIASGASGTAAGVLQPPPTGGGPLAEIRATGRALHHMLSRSLPGESGIAYGYHLLARVEVPQTDAEESEMRRRELDGGRWLAPAELLEMSGWADRPEFGGFLTEEAAQLDPYRFTLALVVAAERGGAQFRTGMVEGLVLRDGHVCAALVNGEEVEAEIVVVAMGPWSMESARWLGLDVPVEPLKGQILKVEPRKEFRPFSVWHGRDYAVARDDGQVFLGTTEEHTGFDRAITQSARDEILLSALRFSSMLEDSRLVEQTACLRPLSSDGLPLIGPVPGLRGAYLATGHGRQGILQAPPTGRAIADLIVDGKTDLLDLSAFTPARFGRP